MRFLNVLLTSIKVSHFSLRLEYQVQWLLQIRQLQIRALSCPALIALFVPKNTTITSNKGTFCMPYLEFLPYLTLFLKTFGWSYLE